MDERDRIDENYEKLARYLENYHYVQAAEALPVVIQMMKAPSVRNLGQVHGEERFNVYVSHMLAVAHYLIDLHLPLSQEEMDDLLTANICHIIPENGYPFDEEYFPCALDPIVYQIVNLTTLVEDQTEERKKEIYHEIGENKLAFLAKIANRGDYVSQLYHQTPRSAHESANDNRIYYFPMCIQAKRRFPELTPIINVVMEKMKSLTEVTEILLSRYEMQEAQIMQEILDLMEDNARISGIIDNLKNA